MKIQPYIRFNGNCQEAVAFYEDVFGTDNSEIILFGEIFPEPGVATNGQPEKVTVDINLESNETRVLMSNIPPKSLNRHREKMTLVIVSDDLDEIEILYYKLKDGGTVEMELQETGWSKVYGALVDKFGVGWQLNYDDGRLHQVV